MNNKVRIGILGAAQIAPRAIIEPAKRIDNIEVYAIAASNIERAQRFANEYNVPYYFDNYQSVIDCKEVDIVYIALANHLHLEWILKAAENKKHILVEKPICLQSTDFKQIEAASIKNDVIILEGTMVQYHPFYDKVREIIDSEVYGKVKSIETYMHYPFKIEGNYRSSKNMGGGVFWDEAVYWLQFTQICKELNPVAFKGKTDFSNPQNIDLTFEAQINFNDDTFSYLSCSYEFPYKYDHWVKFETAKLRIRNFLRSALGYYKLTIDIYNHEGLQIDKIVFQPQNYYENQLRYMIKAINEENKNQSLKNTFERIKLIEKIYNYTLHNNDVFCHYYA